MDSLTAGLEKLTNLLNSGVIGPAEYEQKKSVLVNQYIGLGAPSRAAAAPRLARPPRAYTLPRAFHYAGPVRTLPTLGKGAARGAYSGLVPIPVGRPSPYGRPGPYQRAPRPGPPKQLMAQWGTSIKVQPLPDGVDDQQLADAFAEYGQVVSAAVHRGSPNFGHVNFATQEAASAVAALDKFDWGGQTVLITLSRRRWEVSQEGAPNTGIGIFNLPLTLTQEGLQEYLAVYPGLVNVKMVYNKVSSKGMGGQFKGYAFAHFDTVENATLAKSQLMGAQFEDCVLDVKFANKPTLDPLAQ
eukprot:EG_transcript_16621